MNLTLRTWDRQRQRGNEWRLERESQVDNSKYMGAVLGCFISYKLIWRKLELNIIKYRSVLLFMAV